MRYGWDSGACVPGFDSRRQGWGIDNSTFLPRGILAACSQTLKMAMAHVWQSTRYELADTLLILQYCCNLEC